MILFIHQYKLIASDKPIVTKLNLQDSKLNTKHLYEIIVLKYKTLIYIYIYMQTHQMSFEFAI